MVRTKNTKREREIQGRGGPYGGLVFVDLAPVVPPLSLLDCQSAAVTVGKTAYEAS